MRRVVSEYPSSPIDGSEYLSSHIDVSEYPSSRIDVSQYPSSRIYVVAERAKPDLYRNGIHIS